MTRVHNFNPGPAVLPEPVLKEAAAGILDLGGTGMSVLEISHRAEPYRALHREAQQAILRLLKLEPDEYCVLFLGGGASLQFLMLPMNYLQAGQVADYIDTGLWSQKAIAEARRVGELRIPASSADAHYRCLPSVPALDGHARYLHITTNNTIEGTQWPELPETGAMPLVADMSSDFLSRVLDYLRFSLIYAGAQKNAGPAGVTIVVVRRAFLEEARGDLPPMLSYRVHAREDSLYNTPPVFGVYVVGLVCRWLEAIGGLEAVERLNRQKAQCIYEALEECSDVYELTVTHSAHRSMMNITFRLRDPSIEAEFLQGAEERRMIGLKGHRSVGGFRASCYNALPLASAEILADYLRAFARSRRSGAVFARRP